MGYVDNFVVSSMGVVGDFTVHGEPIGVTCAISETVPTDNAMVQASLCGTIKTCVAQCDPVLTQATPSTTGYAGVVAYAAQCGSIMPRYIESAPAQIQTPPTAAAMALAAVTTPAAASPHT